VGTFAPRVELRFSHNRRVSGAAHRVIRYREPVTPKLSQFAPRSFDAVLLDGSYIGATFADAPEAWRVLKPGGVLLVDGWFLESVPAGGSPPVDALLEAIGADGEILFRDYEIALRKR
jgi:predicted O-methyltransferase YrrM